VSIKTEAGFRDVDLHPSLADMLRSYIGDREWGFLFESKNGTMIWPGMPAPEMLSVDAREETSLQLVARFMSQENWN
jgi:hypothetical protein